SSDESPLGRGNRPRARDVDESLSVVTAVQNAGTGFDREGHRRLVEVVDVAVIPDADGHVIVSGQKRLRRNDGRGLVLVRLTWELQRDIRGVRRKDGRPVRRQKTDADLQAW